VRPPVTWPSAGAAEGAAAAQLLREERLQCPPHVGPKRQPLGPAGVLPRPQRSAGRGQPGQQDHLRAGRDPLPLRLPAGLLADQSVRRLQGEFGLLSLLNSLGS